jgi:molybdenum cofactor biosynthesis enzyme MoaA
MTRAAMSSILSQDEIEHWQPYRLVDDGLTPMQRTRQRMHDTGQWADWQMQGRRMAIGCVALEITQRCNLDCTYCYLSESSEALKDIPLDEVFRRIEMIHRFYGANTDVQVTGGDPTLRKRDELIAIVKAIKSYGMRASLFTNGIKASRDLLVELCAAGLDDVAFHVDMSQERSGYVSEAELNAVRLDYINRARGLPLSVMFNTTIFPGNFLDIPALAQFFVQHADVVKLASFQVGADTGRGTERERVAITSASVITAINQGAGCQLKFDAASAGHATCNGYAYGLIINGKVHDFFNDPAFVQEILSLSSHIQFDRTDKRRSIVAMSDFLLSHPRILFGFFKRAAKLALKIPVDLMKARGKIGKISFFVHNFMDAQALDKERCEACSFMLMTGEGPLSMCVNNAKRDAYLLLPSAIKAENKLRFFNPITGLLEDTIPKNLSVALNRKNARGRAKDDVNQLVEAIS